MQIEHRALARRRELPDVGGAPRVFDDPHGIAPAFDRLGDRAFETGKPIDQRRYAARNASGIAKRARWKTAPVGLEIQHRDAACLANRKQSSRVGGARLPEHDHVHLIVPRQVLE
jgi:hypothetical protein